MDGPGRSLDRYVCQPPHPTGPIGGKAAKARGLNRYGAPLPVAIASAFADIDAQRSSLILGTSIGLGKLQILNADGFRIQSIIMFPELYLVGISVFT